MIKRFLEILEFETTMTLLKAPTIPMEYYVLAFCSNNWFLKFVVYMVMV